MMRHVLALSVLGFGLVVATQADIVPGEQPKKEEKKKGDPRGVTIDWYGQSFFEVTTTKGTTIAIDPHAIPNFGRIFLESELVLASHLHSDHTQFGVIDNRAAKVLCGLKRGEKKEEFNPLDEKFKDVVVKSINCYHDDAEGMKRGKNSILLIDIDGIRIAHLGDLGHLLSEEQIKAIGKVDVLMIPVGGVYTLNGDDAKKVVNQIKPTKYILPMHYGNKDYDEVLTAEEFLEDQDKEFIKHSKGNRLLVEPKFETKKPVICMLHWAPEEEKPKEEKPKEKDDKKKDEKKK